MSNRFHFDYIIIGSGLAGLQLALKMAKDPFFKKKHIALIDPSKKDTNDKTWSFWETPSNTWDHIVCKTWNQARIFTSENEINLNLAPYQYKSIKAIDFYNTCKLKLSKHNTIHFILENVISITETKTLLVKTNLDAYTTDHVFDSRLPNDFLKLSKDYITIKQHFKGFFIKTKEDIFDENKITMMDYRLKDGNQTTFTYVLPFSKKEALIEFTYFTKNKVDEATYDKYIKKYIEVYLGINSYSILETEQGEIPMTTFPFYAFNTKKITKIGTGGGWVKASTGYSFKHTEKKVSQIIQNIKTDKKPSSNLFKRKFKFYDKIFLKVLNDENHKGEWIFQQFYKKNKTKTMFRFLDEESNFFEELKIICSLFSWSFIKALFKILK